MSKDCWAKGGGHEGQGPKGRKGGSTSKTGRANQACEDINNALNNDVAYMAINSTPFSKYNWLLNSGSTSHICPNKDALIDYLPVNTTIHGIGAKPAVTMGCGMVIVNFDVNGTIIPHKLQDVWHIPEAKNCLVLQGRFDDSGGSVHLKNGKVELYNKNGKIVGQGVKRGRLFILNARAQIPSQERINYAASHKLSWNKWHQRYGNISISALQQLKNKHLVDGLSVDESTIPPRSCKACIQAKQHHKPFPSKAQTRAENPREHTMSDVCGPILVKSIEGFKHFITFMDDSKRYNGVVFLKDKTEAAERIEEHGERVKAKFGAYPKYIHFDNGKELVNARIKNWAAKRGIKIETTAPYSPSKNGVAEQYNRTLLELARAMLISKNLPLFLWDQAVSYANYIQNRAPTCALDGMTPYEGWNGKKQDVLHLREFGCNVWVLDETKNLSKLLPQSKR
jgi:transposase InsO family protein